jgi:hypothetical protein
VAKSKTAIFFAGLIGLGPLILSTWGLYQASDLAARGPFSEKQLQLDQGVSVDPLWNLSQPGPLKATFDFDGERVDNLQIAQSTITNVGRSPILAADFVEPLTVQVEGPWRILAIRNSEFPSSLPVVWKRADERTMRATPLLINQGDRIHADVYMTKALEPVPPGSTATASPSLKWTTRIPNMQAILNAPDVHGRLLAATGSSLNFRVGLTGWAVPFAILLTLVNQGVFIVWLDWLGLLGSRSIRSLGFLLASTLLSMCAAEACATYVFDDPITVLTGINHWLNAPILLVHAAVVAAMLILTSKRRIAQETRTQG